jgi:predicted MFS family arabinose efflux permease
MTLILGPPVYAYQGAIVAHLFNGRTRALVSLLTGLGAIIGSIIIGFILDNLPFARRSRSLIGCAAVIAVVIISWAGGLAFQVTFTRTSEHPVWDWTSSGAAGPIVLFMFCESLGKVGEMRVLTEEQIMLEMLCIRVWLITPWVS